MRYTTLLVLITGLSACAADVGQDESNLSMASSMSKKLQPPVAVPTDTPVGRSFQTVVGEVTAGYKASQPKTAKHEAEPGVVLTYTTTYFTNANDKGYYQLQQQPTVKSATGAVYKGMDILRYYDGKSSMPAMLWVDHNLDGFVDKFADDRKGTHSFADENYDRRVDRWVESVANLPGFKVEGYGEGWVPPQDLANRILEDQNFDGFFEIESITGGKSWWTKQP